MKLAIKSLCNRQLDLDTKPNKSDDNGTKRKRKDTQVWRDILAFWILGLGSEFGYFVVISAAHDILQGFEDNSIVDEIKSYSNDDIYSIRQKVCATASAGALLIVDVVPSMLMNIALPFLPTWLHYRMILVITLNFVSFLMIAETQFLAIFGIIFISLAEGMGEVTILSYSAQFDKRVLTAWSSGTGSSGIIGSLSWAGLIALGVTPRNTLRIMLIVPVIEAAAFWILLRKPQNQVENGDEKSEEKSEEKFEEKNTDIAAIETNDFSPESGNTSEQVNKLSGMKAKLKLLPKLSRFILPLHISFILEYVCVSGLFEMIHIDSSWMESDSQYRWFLVVYQIGVFVSRSFGSILKPRNTWWAPILQIVNACVFGYMAINMSASNPCLVLFFIFALGAVGGTCYNHSFHRVVKELPAYQHKFSLGLLTVAESFGTALGALASIPVHAFLCSDLFAER